jgi:hypothetical protein
MSPWRAFVALALIWPAHAWAGTVRALFVGIDSYEYSRLADASGAAPQFADLHGSVSDALALRAALNSAYKWNFDNTSINSPCPTAAPVATTRSITLLGKCATHDAILGMLNGLIAVSQQGDTVLFYYAGHGAQIQADNTQSLTVGFDAKSSGLDDTILAWDSRGPDDPDFLKDIVDQQLNVIIENAMNVQGANVITIFDSCHAGTADRDAAPGGRHAPTVKVHRLRQPIATRQPAIATVIGHRAHLAAAMDAEIAMEKPFPDGNHGVFTEALIHAIPVTTGYALADILAAVQAVVVNPPDTPTRQLATQHPIGDGLLMTLGGRVTAGLVMPASVAADGTIRLGDGRLGNVTVGSAFALFAKAPDARDNLVAPLAAGHVSAVSDNSATLMLDAKPAAPLPASLFARETDHAFGSTKVAVGISLPDKAGHDAVAGKLAGIAIAETIDPARAEVVIGLDRKPPHDFALLTTSAPALVLGTLPQPADPGFADKVAAAIAPRARIDALTTLANDQGQTELGFCVSATWLNPSSVIRCAVPQQPLVQGRNAYLTVTNNAASARFVYIFAMADDNSVTLLTRQDAPVEHGHVQAIVLLPDFAGTIRFLVLATANAIDGAALEQDGGARDASGCTTTLERLLCQANDGSRDPATPHAGEWAGIVNTVKVVADPAVSPHGG